MNQSQIQKCLKFLRFFNQLASSMLLVSDEDNPPPPVVWSESRVDRSARMHQMVEKS